MWKLYLCLLLCIPAYAEETTVLVELADPVAWQVRENTNDTATLLETLLLNEPRMIPVFYEPADPARRETWYALGMHRWFTLSWRGSTEDAARVAGEIATKPGAVQAEVSASLEALRVPNDFSLYNLWALPMMHCPAAWDRCTGSTDVILAIIDSGCEILHPDLAANMYINPGEDVNGNGVWDGDDDNGVDDDGNGFVDDLCGWDFVTAELPPERQLDAEDYGPRDNRVFPDIFGHGTLVTGTAAAVTDNGQGVASAGWNVRAMPLRAGYARLNNGWIGGYGRAEDFAAAVQYAVDNHARIINISFGSSFPAQVLQVAVLYARANNCLVFASAGNDNAWSLLYPAACDGCLAVAATDSLDRKAWFSTFGAHIDLSAPGDQIWSTNPNNVYHPSEYATAYGTSFAAPNAAAVAALIWSCHGDLTDDDVEAILLASCDDLDALNPFYVGRLGAGRVNAEAALLLAEAMELPVPINPVPDLDHSTGSYTLAWSSDGERDDFVRFRIYINDVPADSVTDPGYAGMLPEYGFYRVGITALYTAGESLPVRVDLNWRTNFGLPFADDFESDLLGWWRSGWVTQVQNPERGGQVARLASAVQSCSGLERLFPGRDGGECSGWTLFSDLPEGNGEQSGIHFIGMTGDLRGIAVSADGRVQVRQASEQQMEPVWFDSTLILQANTWYGMLVREREGLLHGMIHDAGWNVLANRQLSLGSRGEVTGVWLRNCFTPGYTVYDNVVLREWTDRIEHFDPEPERGEPYAIIVASVELDGTPIRPGDEIAVFDGSICVGAVEVDGRWPLVLNAWSETPWEPGHPMSFRLWRAGEQSDLDIYPAYDVGDGNFGYGLFSRVEFTPEFSAADPMAVAASRFALDTAYPNPFNAVTQIRFELPAAGAVRLRVYDLLGREAATLVSGLRAAGTHVAVLDASALASGIYIYRLEFAGQMLQRKVVLLK